MSTRTAETSPLVNARIAGALYLTLVPLGFFSLYISSSLVAPGDAAATASRIMASESLFRLGIVSALLVQIVNISVIPPVAADQGCERRTVEETCPCA